MAITTATKPQQKQKVPWIVARARFKQSGIVVYRMASGDKFYHVTLYASRITSCVEGATGEPCKGWKFNQRCHHASLVMEREAERRQAS